MAVSLAGDESTRDQRANRLPQYTVILLATLANFSIGTCLAWTSQVLYIYKRQNSFTEQEVSWLCGLVPLGATLGSLPAEVIANRIGRKGIIKISSVLLVLCWLIIGLVSNNLWIFLTRFLAGIACGAHSIVIPIYLNEIVEHRFRDSLRMICQLQMYLGILFTYCAGFSVDLLTIALLCALAPTILSVASFVIPESPVWLIRQNREAEADDVLKSLKRTESVSEEDISRIDDDVPLTGCVSVFKANSKATMIAFSLMSMKEMSGMVILIVYTSTIFHRIYFPLNHMVSSIIAGLVTVIGTYFHRHLLVCIKTKLLLFLSLTVMSISMFILSGYFRLQNMYDSEASSYSWIPYLSLFLFLIAFTIGCEPASWIVIDRIFTKDVRSVTITGSMVCGWISSFMTTKGFQDMVSWVGISTVFAMYGLSSLMGTAFVARMVPETEGKSAEELQMELRSKKQREDEAQA